MVARMATGSGGASSSGAATTLIGAASVEHVENIINDVVDGIAEEINFENEKKAHENNQPFTGYEYVPLKNFKEVQNNC